MLRDIAGIRLCGANFDEVTNILLLDPHEGNKVKPVKGTLLYGRNGAGKSTLAKAVRKAKGESQDTISQAEFLSINNLPIELTEEEKSHVFVFDEEYIDKNVKFHESGLDTIIMLGHQVEIAEQLQEAQKNLEKAKGEFDIQEKTIIENEKIECKNSPKYHIKKMRLALQGDDCWAGRDKLIKNNRQNTGVRDDTYKQFITLTTTKTRDQLIIEFNETLKVLRIAQQGDAAISTKVENQEETTAYTKEYLLLIDDPVSSFDMENKTGIMSFLRYQLGKFLLGNEYTKSIIMTHDLLTYYDSEKMFGELIEASKVKYGGDKPVYKRYELKNKILIPFPHNGRQEYTELMKIVYRFALGDADGYELVIGNIMRQVLEAFSTFQYKKGIEEVSTDRSILAILPEKEYQSYFENLMYRLILNNGSHRLDQTRSMSDMNFFTVISDSEKKRTAKEILCFIYLLNEKHVLAHLDGCSNVQSNLSKWCNDVKNKVGA